MPKRYAKGKFAVGECARSGRKMLLKDMVSDGYYPSLVVDPAWYEGKHPQESLPEIEDPVALWRPAPERDQSGATFRPASALLSFGFALGSPTLQVLAAQPAGQYSQSDFQNNPELISGGRRFDMWIKDDGTRAWTSRLSGQFDQHDISPAWSITPGDWSSRITVLPGYGNQVRGIQLSPDGTKLMSIIGGGAPLLHDANLTTPFDLSSFVINSSKIIGVGSFFMHWKEDGLKMWTLSGGSIFKGFTASTAFLSSSVTTPEIETFDASVDAGAVHSFLISPDGTHLYAAQSLVADRMVSWKLSIPFDVSTAGGFSVGPVLNTANAMDNPNGPVFRPDNGDIIWESDLASGSAAQRMIIVTP